jgi:hypothetical protein
MRQVTGGSERHVVQRHIHADGLRTRQLPYGTHPLERVLIGLGDRGQHDRLAVEQVRPCRARAAFLGTCDRMRRHELWQRLAECGACIGDHVALGAAGIGDDGTGRDARADLRHDLGQLPYRHRQQDQIAFGDLIPAATDLVDHAHLARSVQIGARAAETDDGIDRLDRLQGQRERATDEPDADDAHAPEAHRRQRRRARGTHAGTWFVVTPARPSIALRRASRKRAFSCAVPIDTLRCSGMP